MKLCTFLRLDQSFDGTGLSRGGKLEELIWTEYSTDRGRLSEVARTIRAAVEMGVNVKAELISLHNDDEMFQEGRLITAIHLKRERNSTLVRKKKEATQLTGL